MISIDLGTIEYYDDKTNTFVYDEGGIVRFEYSLKAIYEWEGKWKKPFLKGEYTDEEIIDFYITMALDPFDPKYLTIDIIKTLAKYITDSNTATVFTSVQEGSSKTAKPKIWTAEELYVSMFSAGIDIDFENRNLNRLMTMLKIVALRSEPEKKMSTQDIYKQNALINAQRKAQLKTKG